MKEHISHLVCAFSLNQPHILHFAQRFLGGSHLNTLFKRKTGKQCRRTLKLAEHRRCASSLMDGHLSLKATQNQTHPSRTKYDSESNANLGTICHLKSANPCNIGCSHVKQMGSGRAGCIDNPARSNFLSFNEGWRERLTKCLLITSLFLCVCLGGRQNVHA